MRPPSLGRPALRALLAVSVWLAACSAPAAQPPPRQSNPAAAAPAPASASSAESPSGGLRHKVRLAYVSQGATIGIIDVIRQSGMFERYGVDIDMRLIRTPLSVAAMVAGEVDFNLVGAQPIITSNLEGADTVLVSCGIDTAFWWIVGKPSIAQPQDLKGMRVANSRRGSNLYEVFELALPRWGLASGDVSIVQVEADSDKILAVQNDVADAAVVSVPANVQAVKLGMRQIVDVGELGIPWPVNCLATTRRYIAEQPDAVKAMLQAYIAGTHWLRAHREETIDILMKFSETDDRAAIEEAYNTNVKYQQQVPWPSRNGMQVILNTLSNEGAASASPDRFIDDRFLRELDDSGFTRSFGQ